MEQHTNGRSSRSTVPDKRGTAPDKGGTAANKSSLALQKGKTASRKSKTASQKSASGAPHKKPTSHQADRAAARTAGTSLRSPSDVMIQATPEELAAVRAQLRTIEKALSALFGSDYRRGSESQRSRRIAADIIDRDFEPIVAGMDRRHPRDVRRELRSSQQGIYRADCANALIRFIQNLRDRDDLGHLRPPAPALPGRDAVAGEAVGVQRPAHRAQANHPQTGAGRDQGPADGAGARVRWWPHSTSGA